MYIVYIAFYVAKMYFMHLLLLMVTCLTYTTNSVVYHVVPDDHYLDTNNNTLQHYLDNSEKYFTSHTQLVFLPGKHHLTTDLIVENVSSFTLKGNDSKEMHNIIIYCTKQAQLALRNSHDIKIRHLSVIDCGLSRGNDMNFPLNALDVFNCSHFTLLNFLFACQYQQCGFAVINVVGSNLLCNITSSYMLIVHDMTWNDSTTEIINYNHAGCSSCKHSATEILFYEHSQTVKVTIFQMKLNADKAMNIISSTFTGVSILRQSLVINKMELVNVTFTDSAIIMFINNYGTTKKLTGSSIQFTDCSFIKIRGEIASGSPGLISIVKQVYNRIEISVIVIQHCRFSDIRAAAILKTFIHNATPHSTIFLIFVQNTSFSLIKVTDIVLKLDNAYLYL